MAKKYKIIYSDIQPNTKEAGVWVNTTDGNVMIEKDGKWVDDGGNGAIDSNNTITFTWQEAITSGGEIGGSDLTITGYKEYTFTVKEGTTLGEFIYSNQGQILYIGNIRDNDFDSVFQIVCVGDDFMPQTHMLHIYDQDGYSASITRTIQNGDIYKAIND